MFVNCNSFFTLIHWTHVWVLQHLLMLYALLNISWLLYQLRFGLAGAIAIHVLILLRPETLAPQHTVLQFTAIYDYYHHFKFIRVSILIPMKYIQKRNTSPSAPPAPAQRKFFYFRFWISRESVTRVEGNGRWQRQARVMPRAIGIEIKEIKKNNSEITKFYFPSV